MLQVKNISVTYGEQVVLHELTFSVAENSIVSFVGANGCGKSTLFNCLREEKQPFLGTIEWGKEGVPKYATVDQHYRATLLPWATVRDNICFPLALEKVPKCLREEILADLLGDSSIELPLSAKVVNLSGGQAQLVALLRALLFQPKLLLLDEPFSAFDYLTKWRIREFLLKRIKKQKITTLMISHDPEDCVFMSERVLVLGAKPTTLVKAVNIELREPKNSTLLGSPSFKQLQHEIVALAFGEALNLRVSPKLNVLTSLG